MSAPEYEIKNVNDFLKAPKDRREAMLADFREWMSLQDEMNDRFEDLIKSGVIGLPAIFRWIDDRAAGLRGVKVVLSSPEN